MSTQQVIAVIGSGAFGTAMAFIASENGHSVRMYARDSLQVEQMRKTRKNPKYLQGIELAQNIEFTDSVEEVLRDKVDLVLLCLPAQSTPTWLQMHVHLFPRDTLICSTAKGLYLPTKNLMSTAILQALGTDKKIRFCVLSGPSFATQICDRHPTAVVVASFLLADAVSVQRLLATSRFRIYSSQDVVGVELGGALKNVLAIAAGMIDGSGFGINTMAAFVTRAARELSILALAYGGRAETVNGLSGIGDLMLSCFSPMSRNHSCGKRLVQGEKLTSILAHVTVEGVPTADVAVDFAHRCNLDLPLFAVVHAILQNQITPKQALEKIMNRPLGTEFALL
uniref:Glycerol-3-phosphate dehydrogenase [NAD(+)] n=1 Tax=Aureoumbra lagunensis TaxID=44058 RepID=A0A7S3K223_9STRA|mmetsp:Transcript_3009/g.4683  ORF Transcript_3009/g.4683 Transcript_3009/m.4683 type:complete len:339 (+) Transcript_3009:61-1077(+)